MALTVFSRLATFIAIDIFLLGARSWSRIRFVRRFHCGLAISGKRLIEARGMMSMSLLKRNTWVCSHFLPNFRNSLETKLSKILQLY